MTDEPAAGPLLDTSAWIEFLRASGSETNVAVRALVASNATLYVCDPVAMEVLAGARSSAHERDLRALLARCTHIRTVDADWDAAARLYRSGRSQGVTIRKLMDCLIAAIALRTGHAVLHDDADFDAIARVSGLDARRI